MRCAVEINTPESRPPPNASGTRRWARRWASLAAGPGKPNSTTENQPAYGSAPDVATVRGLQIGITREVSIIVTTDAKLTGGPAVTDRMPQNLQIDGPFDAMQLAQLRIAAFRTKIHVHGPGPCERCFGDLIGLGQHALGLLEMLDRLDANRIQCTDDLQDVLPVVRRRAGLSQSQAAEASIVTAKMISHVERGRRILSVPALLSLINAYGCDLVVVKR